MLRYLSWTYLESQEYQFLCTRLDSCKQKMPEQCIEYGAHGRQPLMVGDMQMTTRGCKNYLLRIPVDYGEIERLSKSAFTGNKYLR